VKIHMVKKGDTLYFIAQKYNVPLEELIKANPEIANPDEIEVGMKVKIPVSSHPSHPTHPSHPAHAHSSHPPYEMIHKHTVQQGDTLWKLSKAWGIPLSDMIKANPQLKNPNVLLTGEIVNIPKIPAAGHHGVSHAAAAAPMPGEIPGKKNTAVMPEAAVEEQPIAPQKPAESVEIEMQIEQTTVFEMPPAPAPAPMPAPQVEMKHPYPMTYPQHGYDHHLFAQFPMPAVEAQAAVEPCPPEHLQMMPQAYGYSHYSPTDWSGEAVANAAQVPSMGPYAAAAPMAYAPNLAPAMVSPFASMPNVHHGCSECGGSPSPYGHPFAGAEWSNPAAAMPTAMPSADWGLQPAAVGPAGFVPGFPGANVPAPFPAAASPMPAMPGMFDPFMMHAPYGMPCGCGDGRYAMMPYPPLPTLPSLPQAGNGEEAGGESSPLALHGADEPSSAPAAPAKKRSVSGRTKRSGAKAKPKRRESLPWIKW